MKKVQSRCKPVAGEMLFSNSQKAVIKGIKPQYGSFWSTLVFVHNVPNLRR